MNKDWKQQDLEYCWHPFTQQQEWKQQSESILAIQSGQGVWLTDHKGRSYIDGNASIWTNIHGHAHPVINQAIIDQLSVIAHSSYLGFANPLASQLSSELIHLVNDTDLKRVFYSDDGSTAVECAMKMELQFRKQSQQLDKVEFIAFDQAYHGDTMGAASLGGVAIFHDKIKNQGVVCHHVQHMQALRKLPLETIEKVCAIVIEPLIQGVNQMRPWPQGMLGELRDWCNQHDIHLILDEVMTGFGRTGKMFAYQHEGISPDYICLAKGLTGGYLPMAATITSEKIYQAFLGEVTEHKAFYYGHSYTANPLGCAAALANLKVFREEKTLDSLPHKIKVLASSLDKLKEDHPEIYEVRQCGMIVGIELRQINQKKFPAEQRLGHQVCLAARDHQLLTRPILDTIVFLPPLCITPAEIEQAIEAISKAITQVIATI